MKLNQNKELFQDAVLAASQRFGIPEIYVEKDYWVTLALYEIFHSNIADQIVFKGRTSLSKCHKLIQRFSDDFISYKNNNAWLEEHPCSALIFKDPKVTWNHIKSTYRTIFKELVIGKLPNENDLIDTLKKIEKRMKPLAWEI